MSWLYTTVAWAERQGGEGELGKSAEGRGGRALPDTLRNLPGERGQAGNKHSRPGSVWSGQEARASSRPTMLVLEQSNSSGGGDSWG